MESINPFNLQFSVPVRESTFRREWATSWRTFDLRWTFVQAFLASTIIFKCPVLVSAETAIIAGHSLCRCLAFGAACLAPDYVPARTRCMVLVKVHRTALILAAWQLDLIHTYAHCLRGAVIDCVLGNLLSGIGSALPFTQQVPLHTLVTAATIIVVLAPGGVCDSVHRVAAAGGQQAAECTSLHGVFTRSSSMCEWLVKWATVMPLQAKDLCRLQLVFAQVAIGWALPCAILYAVELGNRRAYLMRHGVREAYNANLFSDPVLLTACTVSWLCTIYIMLSALL